MKKVFLILLVTLVLIIPSCQPGTGLTSEQKYRMELVEEIKAFEKKLDFKETENFRAYSSKTEAYDYYFYTPIIKLPYSLGDPLLQFGTGTRQSANIDTKKYDVYFYSIQALAGIKTPVTRSLIEAPLSRFIFVIIHEDWHEQIDLPLGIEEPSGQIVGYAVAMLFAREKFGSDSTIYKTLGQELNGKLKESKVYSKYYEQLQALYAEYKAGIISETETSLRKEQSLKAMGDELKEIWGAKPDQLNNAFIAFQMTYLRHLPLMYQVFLAADSNLNETLTIFRSMPEQGISANNLDDIKRIEKQVTDYLQNKLGSIKKETMRLSVTAAEI